MSGAKFGRRSIMGLAGEVANPSLNTDPLRWFLCRKPDAAPVAHSAHKRPRRRVPWGEGMGWG